MVKALFRSCSLLLLLLIAAPASAQYTRTLGFIFSNNECAITSGSGAPSGGKDCDRYVRDAGADSGMYINVDGTWVKMASMASLSSTATGLTYTAATGVFSLTSGYVIPTTTQETNWGSAYTWVNAFGATTCTNQFVSAISGAGAGTCTTPTLASAQFANQGTTTTILHGNGAGNPSWGALVNNDVDANAAIALSKLASTGDLGTAVTIGTAYIYRAGGTDVPLLDGGTNASLTASHGAVVYSTAAALALTGVGTAGQLLQSAAAGSPTWTSDILTSTTIGTAYIYRAGGTDIPVADGGTGLSTLTAHAVYVGNGTSAPTALAVGATGKTLIGATGADPSWEDVLSSVPTGLTYTTSTRALSLTSGYMIPGGGSAGQWLASAGASAPAWSTATLPTTATGTGKILRADGTNWVATTATFPNTASTTGAYLRADGTNWITSTLVLPNAATSGYVVFASGTNTYGEDADLTFSGDTLTATKLIGSTSLQTPSIITAAGPVNLSLAPTGDLVTNPGGKDILPNTGYDINIGALTTKYLSLHAAELWVETLVAQDTIATIGGRVLVAPTTILVADLTDAATTIHVKHNQMASGDRVYMEAAGKVEFLSIDSAAGGSAGDYTYTVTRNLDGSGANAWYAGDAILNTGTTGNGFIDLYSVDGMLSGAGPTIVGNVRTGTTYNNIAARWACGNLNGLYGYAVTTYGCGFGDYAETWVAIDATNGFRVMHGADVKTQVDAAGNASFTGAVTAASGTIGGWTIGASSLTDAAGTVGLSSAVTGGDDIRFWAGHATPPSAPIRIYESGILKAGANVVTLDTNGITITAPTAAENTYAYKFSSVFSGSLMGLYAEETTSPFNARVLGLYNTTTSSLGISTISIGAINDSDGVNYVAAVNIFAGTGPQVEVVGSFHTKATVAGSNVFNVTTGGVVDLGTWNAGAVTSSGVIKVRGGDGSGADLEVYGAAASYALQTWTGRQVGDVTWLAMSGYPNAGDFSIRQSGVGNALTFAKTTLAATFAAGVTMTSLTTTGSLYHKQAFSDAHGDGPFYLANADLTRIWGMRVGTDNTLNLDWFGGSSWSGDVLQLTSAGALTVAAGVNATTGIFSNYVQVSRAAATQLYLKYSGSLDTYLGTRSDGQFQMYAYNGSSYKNILLASDGNSPAANLLVGTDVDHAGERFQVAGTAYVSGNTVVGGTLGVGATATWKFTVGSATDWGAHITATGSGGPTLDGGVFIGSRANNIGSIQGSNGISGDPASLSLQTEGGNVLIGTTTDDGRKLNVYGSGQFKDASGISTTIWSEASSGVGGIGTNNNYPFAVLVNGSEVARFATGTATMRTILPAATGTYDLGATGSRYVSVWAAQWNGLAPTAAKTADTLALRDTDGDAAFRELYADSLWVYTIGSAADTGKVVQWNNGTGALSYLATATAATGSTIVLRDADGDITGTDIHGSDGIFSTVHINSLASATGDYMVVFNNTSKLLTYEAKPVSFPGGASMATCAAQIGEMTVDNGVITSVSCNAPDSLLAPKNLTARLLSQEQRIAELEAAVSRLMALLENRR